MAGAQSALDITLNDAEIQAELKQLAAKLNDLTPFFRDVGETLLNSTRERFNTSTAPDGTPWKPLGPAALLARARRAARGGTPFITRGQNKGRYGKGAARAVAFAKPLVLSGDLRGTLVKQADANSLRIGTPLAYGATHQFGRGAIPARPFLGLSEDDRQALLDALNDYLARD